MRIWPFLTAPFIYMGYFFFEQHVRSLAVTSSPRPNEAAGEIWAITFRGGVTRYVGLADYIIFNAPLFVAPLIVGAALGFVVFMRHTRGK